MFDLVWYVNLILSHGISALCLQVWTLNISLSNLDFFDLPSLHSQVLITWLKSQARAPALHPTAAKCVHVYIDLCWDQNRFRLRKCLSDGGGEPCIRGRERERAFMQPIMLASSYGTEIKSELELNSDKTRPLCYGLTFLNFLVCFLIRECLP